MLANAKSTHPLISICKSPRKGDVPKPKLQNDASRGFIIGRVFRNPFAPGIILEPNIDSRPVLKSDGRACC